MSGGRAESQREHWRHIRNRIRVIRAIRGLSTDKTDNTDEKKLGKDRCLSPAHLALRCRQKKKGEGRMPFPSAYNCLRDYDFVARFNRNLNFLVDTAPPANWSVTV